MGLLDNKVALVTGGTEGIGLAAAARFAQEGARVYVTGRRQATLDAAVAQIGPSAVGVRGDVSDLAQLDHLVSEIRGGAGHLDVLFPNAGGGAYAPLGEITEEDFDTTFTINVKGVLFAVQKALPLLRDGASVILPGSTSASRGLDNLTVYAATKAAIRSFTRTWAAELAPRRIRVNAISPGPVETPGLFSLAGDDPAARDALRARFAQRAPLGRIGHVDEVAAAALFLASDLSSYTTGAELFVDGGLNQI